MKSLTSPWKQLIAVDCSCLCLGAMARPPEGGLCRSKYDTISGELADAKAQGHGQRARGLQRALDEVSRHCSEDKLHAEHARRIRVQEHEVTKRQRELEQAQQQGRSDKVERRQSKLQAAQDELRRLKDDGPG